jgi:hypothetical protein
MKRRNFVQNLLLAPVAPAVAAAATQTPSPQPAIHQKPATEPKTPVRERPWGPHDVPKLDLTGVDLTGQPAPHYFTAAQFATLRKLGALFVPPLKSNPGALEAQAPEFLDFLIGASPDDRQNLYRFGLDSLDSQSRDQFQKPFCDLDAQQADRILRPLLVVRPWAEDFPSDPLQKFIAQVHEDLRTATMNSREWAAASEKSGRHFTRGFRGSGYYWFPIDPISQG